MATPRCALRMPLGLCGARRENSTPASLGSPPPPSRGSIRGVHRDHGQGRRPMCRRRGMAHRRIVARWRRNGNLADCSGPRPDLPISGASSDRTAAKSVFNTSRSNNSTATLPVLSRYSSSAEVENVLSVTARHRRARCRRRRDHSGRFASRPPTRVSLPTPLARGLPFRLPVPTGRRTSSG